MEDAELHENRGGILGFIAVGITSNAKPAVGYNYQVAVEVEAKVRKYQTLATRRT